ncbi:hypothetical protein LTR94_036389, partial [Friedmanniomyces endolithicus]
ALQEREARVRARVELYRTTASVEGGVAGAGGFLMAAADFPALMAIKVKMLFEIAALYGYSGRDLKERRPASPRGPGRAGGRHARPA